MTLSTGWPPGTVTHAGRPEVRDAAFGARPGGPVRVRPDAGPHERWLAAVALGGQGRYAAAAAILQALVAGPSVPAGTAAHAAVTLAAHRRQLGGHAAARRWDALGLRLACAALAAEPVPAGAPDPDGTDAAAARADALIGLAADAIGAADVALAGRLLERADSAAREHPSWRPAVRAGWVGAELALLRGEPAAALAPAERALRLAAEAGAARHLLKSRIVAAVVRAAADPPAAAAMLDELDGLAADATRFGQLPLRWPAELAAADLAERVPAPPLTGPGRPPGVTETACPVNDRGSEKSRTAPNDTLSDAPRRRHAAAATLSVIYRNSDPIGRRLMGESAWVPEWPGVM
ncbi:hypothetical protein [Pseudonocardia acidicola]|uniref:Uncharacterized protein n=1 Tax=Pseudonocardia acidicola TaxID=2724939 RepID=A0ABX1SC21_9PSEU|nr:hypothetical protein [Pseudonocardia acidicola]NMH99113.1 hypothetical protein [Pseudonocardia acidicola]